MRVIADVHETPTEETDMEAENAIQHGSMNSQPNRDKEPDVTDQSAVE